MELPVPSLYDLFGRPIKETKNEMVWEITYDDVNHRITRTHQATGTTETQDFDARGNLLRKTDAAGFTMERSYDGLGRVKTETAPNGDLTSWSYQGDTVICTLPTGEYSISHYEGGNVASTEIFSAHGHLLSNASMCYDPVNESSSHRWRKCHHTHCNECSRSSCYGATRQHKGNIRL